MRLGMYLTEAGKIEWGEMSGYISRIRRDCKPWLDEIKGTGNQKWNRVIYRGIKGTGQSVFVEKEVRTDRKAVDTPSYIQAEADRYFLKKFGWKGRSEGMFAISSRATVEYYGEAYMVFPVGEFKYIWSPKVDDFYSELQGMSTTELLRDYTNKDIGEALYAGHEVMIKCKKYYGLQWKEVEKQGKDMILGEIFE